MWIFIAMIQVTRYNCVYDDAPDGFGIRYMRRNRTSHIYKTIVCHFLILNGNRISFMINKQDNPVEWAALLYELSDAQEHLEKLLKDMNLKEQTDEIFFKISLVHIYGHLNRAFNSRSHIGDIENNYDEYSQFPKDTEIA